MSGRDMFLYACIIVGVGIVFCVLAQNCGLF